MIRGLTVGLVAAFSCFGFAEEKISEPILLAADLLPNQDVGSSQQGVLPPPNSQTRHPLTIVNADKSYTRGTVTVFEGNVHLEYKGYTLKAARIEGDSATDIYILSGGGSLMGEGDVIQGETIRVNFKEDTYMLEGGKAVITPERTQGLTTGPFYVSGGKASLRDPHFHLYDGTLTPCDLDHPHFAFDAGSTEVVPGKKIVFRDFGLVILGKRVLGLPYLYIPLLDDRPRYLPEFGQSQDEGYFVKSRYITPLRGEDRFETRLDYMTKLGFGVGGELGYDTQTMSGSVGAYGLTGTQNSLVGNLRHQQLLGASRLDIDARFQRNNYLTAPSSSLLSSRAQLTVPSGAGQSTFGYFRNSSDTGAFTSVTESLTASDVRQFGKNTRTNISTTWSKSQSINSGSVLSESERVDVRFQGYQELRSFAADLLFQRSIPIGDSQSFSSASDRTPLLTLRSDTTRLFGPKAGRNWPTRLEASIGELRNPGGEPITRMTFGTDLNRREELGRGFSLDWNGQYRQGFYSDDTAQYVLGYGGNLRYQFGSNSNLRLSYRNQKQFGFTPLAIDFAGQNDVFQFGADVGHGKGWTSSLTTGYDVLAIERQQTPWQIVTYSSTYNGYDSYFQFAANYDTFNQTWGLFRADSRFKIGGTGISASARYDGQRAVWAAGSLQIEGFKWGQISTNAVLFYNGYTKQLEAQQYQISYDLHCTEAVLEITDFKSGFRSGRQIAFYIRIKALPFGSDFGTGRRGQSIGGTGGFGF
ncbi:MAG: LPS-assembly protein LptD [Fimbriimonadaceae bacterium]|nr:LPS-assembly protein LptD [Fimbriimonadaceae bacterium]